MSDETSDAIVLDRVTAGYAARDVFTDLSLAVRRGEFLGVLGPNGCGKTTLLRVLSGPLAPRAGRATVLGRDAATTRPRELSRHVAVLPQDTAPLFAMAVLEVVLLGRHPWRGAFSFEDEHDLALARAALEEVAAGALADRDFATLSGGERQRVLLARALCQGGEVLLCDEPTAHLDLSHQAAAFRLLRDLRRTGRTVVAVTHDVDLATRACDRLALFGPSGLVAVGTPVEVVTPARLQAAFGGTVTVLWDPNGLPVVVRELEDEGKGGRS